MNKGNIVFLNKHANLNLPVSILSLAFVILKYILNLKISFLMKLKHFKNIYLKCQLYIHIIDRATEEKRGI